MSAPNSIPIVSTLDIEGLVKSAQSLQNGDILIIPCITESQRESLRTGLYRYLKSKDIKDIIVSRSKSTGIIAISITKISVPPTAYIVRKDGNIEQL